MTDIERACEFCRRLTGHEPGCITRMVDSAAQLQEWLDKSGNGRPSTDSEAGE